MGQARKTEHHPGQLSDGVIAVDKSERIQTLNPAMADWLGVDPPPGWGELSSVCPELSLKQTLRLALPELERIEKIRGKTPDRQPHAYSGEQVGELTGAVLTCRTPSPFSVSIATCAQPSQHQPIRIDMPWVT